MTVTVRSRPRECGDEKRLSIEPTEPEVGIVDEVFERFKTGAEEEDAIAAGWTMASDSAADGRRKARSVEGDAPHSAAVASGDQRKLNLL